MTIPKSIKYEQFTQKVIGKLLDSGIEVHHQKVYRGRISQRDIKVDVSFNCSVAGANLLFIVECKCYNHAVPVDDVEEFHSKIDDIGAHKGIMVTTKGYQSGTIKTAKGRGIALALLTQESQDGEMDMIVASIKPITRHPSCDSFWQGNFLGVLDMYEGGFRFNNPGQFNGMLIADAMMNSVNRLK